MDPAVSAKILVAVTVLYGLGVAALYTLDVAAAGTITIIGALVLAALWVVRGLVVRKPTKD